YDIFGTLGAGGCIVMPEASATREPRAWAAMVERHGVSIWNTVPALMELLVEEVRPKNGATLKSGSKTELSSASPSALETRLSSQLRTLRLVLLSGDWIAVSLPSRIAAVAPHAEVISLGGATEASIWSILYPIEEVKADWKSIPYGHPMTNQRFYVLNERMESCPPWVTGQLYIGGVGLAQGYWRDEAKTGASFIRHEATGERLYRTGDLGRYREDGEIEFLGREDTQVKVQGHRIELGEVEAALEEHEGVKQAVVVALGERDGDRRLVGYVVREGGEIEEGELREHLRRKVPEYMVPGVIMEVEEMPLTGNGKVNRQALPAPDGVLLEIARHYVAPRDLIEERTANLCAQLLKVERVGVYDDFFWLGGNSLSAIQLIAKLRDEFEVELPVSKIFLDPNVASLALAILNGLVEKEDEGQMKLLLDELERLPEEELDRLLQQEADKTAEGKDYE
ncbi:MAG TPA: non-ribosomal peptide synthetase, partial [Pyrinomonadaceae bacterium]|nr:non-ribosomal peptide synthetase [Pyrinomonadaceae bacterium]